MPEVKEREESVERVVGRGRDERTPVYLHLGVFLAVGLVVGVVVGVVFLAQALV